MPLPTAHATPTGLLCFLTAIVLHATLLLLRVETPTAVVRPTSPSREDTISVSVEGVPARAPKLGGGAEITPGASRTALAPRAHAAVVHPRLERTAAPRAVVQEELRPVVPQASDAGQGLAPLPRLRPARTKFVAARSGQSSDPDLGSEPGKGSGPGGNGRGFGGQLVKNAFAFGGPSGAFRAEVCFIPEPVRGLKEVRDCAPAATFFTNVLDVPPRAFTEGFPGITERTEWFRIEYRGKFRVKAADYYEFRLLSDDGALLYVDGHRIIDNDGQHPPQSKAITITLEAGDHDLFVSYYQGPRDNIALQLFVTRYGKPERLFGPEL